MNDTKRNTAPLDEGVYQTGTLEQHPSRSGWIMAVLLAAVVILGGVVTILGLLNIRLFAALQRQEKDTLQLQNLEPSAEIATTTGNQPRLSLELQEGQEDVTPQQIYTNCKDAMVDVRSDGVEGTGLVLSTNGYVLVDCSLVQDARQLYVVLPDQQCLSARLVGKDPLTNLAVLYVDADLTAPVFGDSESLSVGDTVITIGDGTLSNGTVAAVTEDTIRTDTQRDYTGPVMDRFGQVIGVQVGGSRYAIPTATLKLITEQLVGQGYVSGRPGLGIRWEPVPELHQKFYTLPAGLYVTKAEDNSGLSVGDILVSINGRPVESESELMAVLSACRVGDTATLEIYRNGSRYTVTARITEAKR